MKGRNRYVEWARKQERLQVQVIRCARAQYIFTTGVLETLVDGPGIVFRGEGDGRPERSVMGRYLATGVGRFWSDDRQLLVFYRWWRRRLGKREFRRMLFGARQAWKSEIQDLRDNQKGRR